LAFVADFGAQIFNLKTKFDMENGNDANRLFADVFSLDELKIGDKVTIRFAQRYDRKTGWSEFYDADYIVKHNEGKSVVFEHCIHKHTCHRMFNVGNRNSHDWIVGKWVVGKHI
jgi:hypothetical protein